MPHNIYKKLVRIIILEFFLLGQFVCYGMDIGSNSNAAKKVKNGNAIEQISDMPISDDGSLLVIDDYTSASLMLFSQPSLASSPFSIRIFDTFEPDSAKMNEAMVRIAGLPRLKRLGIKKFMPAIKITGVFVACVLVSLLMSNSFAHSANTQMSKDVVEYLYSLSTYNRALYLEIVKTIGGMSSMDLGESVAVALNGILDAFEKVAGLFALSVSGSSSLLKQEARTVDATDLALPEEPLSENDKQRLGANDDIEYKKAIDKAVAILYHIPRYFTKESAVKVGGILSPFITENGKPLKASDATNLAFIVRDIFINPSLTAEETIERVKTAYGTVLTYDDIKRYYKIIRENEICQDLFEHSRHSRFIRMTRILLDSKDFLDKYLAGEKPSPVQLEIHPSNWCPYHCSRCINDRFVQDLKNVLIDRKKAQKEDFLKAMDAVAQLPGFKKFILSGGLEPSCSPFFGDLLKKGKELGKTTVAFSNGVSVDRMPVNEVIESDGMKVSLGNADPDKFAVEHGVGKEDFYKVLESIEAMVQAKKEAVKLDEAQGIKKKYANIDISMVVAKENWMHMVTFAEKGVELGVDVVRFNEDFLGSLETLTPSEERLLGTMVTLIREAYGDKVELDFSSYLEGLEARVHHVYFEELKKPTKCYLGAFKMVIDNFGDVWVCSRKSFPNEPDHAFQIGNILEESMEEILKKDIPVLNPERCSICPPYEQGTMIAQEMIKANYEKGISHTELPFAPIGEAFAFGKGKFSLEKEEQPEKEDISVEDEHLSEGLIPPGKKAIVLMGVGYFGNFILRSLIKLIDTDKYHIVAVAGRNYEERLKNFGPEIEAGQVTVVQKDDNNNIYKQLMKNPSVEGVLIATPAATHAELSEIAVRNGVRVYVEKPFTLSEKDASKLLSISSKNKVPVQVGYIQLHNPFIHVMKKLISERRFGDIEDIEFTVCNPMPNRQLDDLGALRDWAPHLFSILYYLFDDIEMEVVSAKGEKPNPKSGNPEKVTINLQARTGDSSRPFNISMVIDREFEESAIRLLDISGSKGEAVFDFAVYRGHKGTFMGKPENGKESAVIDFRDMIDEKEYKDIDNPLDNELGDFVNQIENHSSEADKSHTDNIAVKVVPIIDSIEEALRENGEMGSKLALSDIESAEVVASLDAGGKVIGVIKYKGDNGEEKLIYDRDPHFLDILFQVVKYRDSYYSKLIAELRDMKCREIMRNSGNSGAQMPGKSVPLLVDVRTLKHNPGWMDALQGLNVIYYASNAREMGYLNMLHINKKRIFSNKSELNKYLSSIAADLRAAMVVIGDIPVNMKVKNHFVVDSEDNAIDWEVLRKLLMTFDENIFLPMMRSNDILKETKKHILFGA